MKRAYVFRLRPTARQHAALAACVESHRELYNVALQERRDAWTHRKMSSARRLHTTRLSVLTPQR